MDRGDLPLAGPMIPEMFSNMRRKETEEEATDGY
jgi:hypothetical protein